MNANRVVGAKVYIAHTGSWATEYQLTTITKVTPSGQVSVAATNGKGEQRRFTANDQEIGCQMLRTPHLAWNVAQITASLLEGKRCRGAADKLTEVTKVEFRREWGAESLADKIAQMRKLLDEAEDALKV